MLFANGGLHPAADKYSIGSTVGRRAVKKQSGRILICLPYTVPYTLIMKTVIFLPQSPIYAHN